LIVVVAAALAGRTAAASISADANAPIDALAMPSPELVPGSISITPLSSVQLHEQSSTI
jgi:hypothetical protein